MVTRELSSEKRVYKENDTVRRPLEPWSDNIHALLRHFYRSGLPVPRIIKTDGVHEYVEYIEGEQIHPYKWNDELLVEIAALVKKLHDAAGTFGYDKSLVWKPWCLRELGRPALCGHGDIAPWNIISRGNKIIGLIDWEYAGPLDPLIELARVCWLFPQLVDDDLGKLYELPSPRERGRQVRLMLDTYGLSPRERRTFLEKIIETVIAETAHEAIDAHITFNSTGNLWGMAWRTRSLYWIWRNKTILEKEIV
jgi:hypothetical protein